MNVEIAPIMPRMVSEFEIRIAGNRVGEIEQRVSGDGWRAMLSLVDSRLVGSHQLFGYGETHEAAIADAIRNGHSQIKAITERLAELEATVGLDAETLRQVQYS